MVCMVLETEWFGFVFPNDVNLIQLNCSAFGLVPTEPCSRSSEFDQPNTPPKFQEYV